MTKPSDQDDDSVERRTVTDAGRFLFVSGTSSLFSPVAVNYLFEQAKGLLEVGIVVLGGCLAAAFSAYMIFTFGRGTVVDGANDLLIFPTWFGVRTVKLSEIFDAATDYGKRVGFKNPQGGETAYLVNISGEFGSRRLRFWARAYRDQFLSYLRVAAPHVRVTDRSVRFR